MDETEAQTSLFQHWPGFLPQARREDELHVVQLIRWPPSDELRHGELIARSTDGYEAALRDLATFTPPLRCRSPSCPLCGRQT